MKQCKNLPPFSPGFAMILSLAGSTGAKAATSMTVTLYVAQDSKVMIKPVTVTLTDADKRISVLIWQPTNLLHYTLWQNIIRQ